MSFFNYCAYPGYAFEISLSSLWRIIQMDWSWFKISFWFTGEQTKVVILNLFRLNGEAFATAILTQWRTVRKMFPFYFKYSINFNWQQMNFSIWILTPICWDGDLNCDIGARTNRSGDGIDHVINVLFSSSGNKTNILLLNLLWLCGQAFEFPILPLGR